MKNTFAPRAIVFLACMLLASTQFADGADGPISRADRVLHTMSDYLAAIGEFSFHVEVNYDSVLANDQKIQYGGASDVTVRRPDRLRVEYIGDERRSRIIYDGSVFSLLDLERNLYAQTEITSDLDTVMDHILDKYGFTVPIADLVYADPYSVLIENIDTGRWIGRHPVDGVPCDHLAFTQETIDWQIWIEAGPQPVPRKLVITYKDEPSAPQFVARLSQWNFDPHLADSWFHFDVPIGSRLIEFLPVPEEPASNEEEIGE